MTRHGGGTIVRLLPLDAAEALAGSPLSTHLTSTDDAVPPGHRRLVTSRLLVRRDFDAAADELLRWRMHTGAGLRVAASSERAAVGTVVRLTLSMFSRGPGLHVACRVVDVIDEEHRKGFTYATLAGHVESGLQTFTVNRGRCDADDSLRQGTVSRTPQGADSPVRVSVVSVSAPAHPLLRWAGPVPVWAQRIMAARYCAAMGRDTT